MRITLDTIRKIDPIARNSWAYTTAGLSVLWFKATPGVSVRMEGIEKLPREPVVVAMNHTHMFDFLPLRAPLLFKKHSFVSWVKARSYKPWHLGEFLARTGNIPICSRGYILAADYHELFGEMMSEDEYATLRAYLGGKLDELPAGERFDMLQNTKRHIVGKLYEPSRQTYRKASVSLYYELMHHALEMTRKGVDRGDHVHIYPQGTISSQLTPGHTGIIQAASALKLHVIPVGVSGTIEGFDGVTPKPKRSGGEIVVRFGDLIHIPSDVLPKDYRPFHPEDEARYKPHMERHVHTIMEGLNHVCEPDYQWAPDLKSDAKQGIDRFF